ncbi:hypothetical protein CXB51_000586 [Gossypium anomalum]|uniref:DUF4408 domain-containing protein n=1 Tax=Gossypium anomalum TaxID=47600 RepID=A0A8J5ZIN2_9ROSI|nr:hypothetical protein CXB51_000586 [Gossypium anomalum]
MNKFKKSQILTLSIVAALLFIAPLLSSSLRPTYLYFILNLLIISLGVEAGLGSVFTRPSYAAARPVTTQEAKGSVESTNVAAPTASTEKKGNKVVEKSVSEKKIIVGSIKVDKVKKCPSTPSLFFIGSGETEAEAVNREELEMEEEEEEEGDVGGISGPELFTKAEIFIGNFYKQLKMQREESWKNIHGFYQKAF